MTQGSALILSELAGIEYRSALLIVWFSYTSFTLYAGSRGVVITDTLMFLLFASLTLAALFSILDTHGGWMNALGGLANLDAKPDLLEWHGQLGPDKEWQTPADFLIWFLIQLSALI